MLTKRGQRDQEVPEVLGWYEGFDYDNDNESNDDTDVKLDIELQRA